MNFCDMAIIWWVGKIGTHGVSAAIEDDAVND